MYHFNSVEFFLDQFDNCIILGGCLDKFQKQAVFAVVNDFCLEGFCNLKQFCFIFPGAVENLDVRISFILTNTSVKSITLITSIMRFNYFLICSKVSSSLTVAIVIRDTVGSSVVPTVRLIYHEICKWLSEFC